MADAAELVEDNDVMVPMRDGLVYSKNTVTAQVMQDVGLPGIVNLAQGLGIDTPRLAELAETTAHAATDLYAFTSRIDERFEMPQKLKMIEHMWRVAYADGHLSAHERHVMWRIADLLHVPQGAYHHARQRAADSR